MKTKRRSLLWVVVALVASALACNLPSQAAPTPFSFPTPDLTMTAVFTSNPNVIPTSTVPGAGIPTGVPVSTATSAEQAGMTPLPAATATSIPPSPTSVPQDEEEVPTKAPVSYAGPGARKNVSVTANYMKVEPLIDGNFSEWDLERYPVDNLVMGSANWDGEDDASGNFMISWDENYLYIAARVRDDAYVQNTTGQNLYKGDSVEVLFDANVSGDYYLDQLSRDDFQLGISPGADGLNVNPENYLWYPDDVSGYYKKIKASAMPADGGYRLELKIPWSTFGVSPAKGQHFGFAFSISDNDLENKNLQQSLVSSVGTRVLTDPTTWGDLVLSGTPAPIPPVTPAPNPASRSGNSISAAFLSAPPVLDGNLGEWGLTQYPVNHVVYGENKWDNASDLSGSVMVGWDDANLYLGVRGVDNKYVQNAVKQDLFLGDSLEVLLDSKVAEDFYSRSLSGDDFQLGISPGMPGVGTSPEAYLWYPSGQAGSRTQVKIAATAVDGGYYLEAAIPWSVFGITPANEAHYGFAFSISDNDNANQFQQQSMVCNNPGRVLTDPTTWGDLTLVK